VNKQEFLELIDKYLAGEASKEEEQLLLNFFDSFQSEAEWNEELFGVKHHLEEKMLKRLQAAVNVPANKTHAGIRFLSLKNIAAAVMGFALITAAAFYIFNKPVAKQPLVALNKPVKYDAEPGSNKAILTLANGSKLVLNAAKNGVLAKNGSISIRKTKDGQLIYLVEGTKPINTDSTVAYNTISTPVGGQYQVILPDGTMVWLNAASSLKFPTLFKGTQRVVELTGEAYFEVAKNKAMPFSVKVNDMQVKVLGTHFNIMAYTNEPTIQTTLLEGSVALSNGQVNNTLKPGQQGVLNKKGEIKILNVDAGHYVAWKNGYFEFNRSNIQEIMNQLSRWYGIEVTYAGNVPDDEFVGKIERSAKLSQVLRILQLSKVNFKLQDKKIIVTP
jgi:transmembrane sensor